MKLSMPVSASRREFIKNTGKLAAVSALANVAIPAVHAAGSDLIQVALIGCGGRGGGAAANALSVKRGPVKLVAMADIFPDRLQKDLTNLQTQFAGQVDVPPERQFIGFDAYQKAMDCLKPGDIAIFATPPAFRWVHFTYAIQKGLNVFMEKPLTADGPTSKRMFKLGQEAQAKNLKVGVGLMSRHNRAMQELANASTMARLARSFCNGVTGCTGRADISARFRNRPVSPTSFTRCSASTVSSGPAAAALTTSIST